MAKRWYVRLHIPPSGVFMTAGKLHDGRGNVLAQDGIMHLFATRASAKAYVAPGPVAIVPVYVERVADAAADVPDRFRYDSPAARQSALKMQE